MNQIQREFDGLGQMTTEWQAVGGAVNTSTSPKVQYAYSFAPSGSTNHSRLTSITYPNGRVISYNYASGLNADISRLSSISDGGTTLESYEYLGYDTVVKRGHAERGVDLTFIKQGLQYRAGKAECPLIRTLIVGTGESVHPGDYRLPPEFSETIQGVEW